VSQGTLFKTAIGNPFTALPKNATSHVRGWAQHWADLIGDARVMHKGESYAGLDFLYLDHGVNSTPGQLNLFGGVTDEMVWDILDLVMNKRVQIISLDAPMPREAYVEGLMKRLGQATCSRHLSKTMIQDLGVALAKQDPHHLVQEKFIRRYGQIAIGDSHTTSYARPATPVLRNNGLTLHGAIRKSYFTQTVASLVMEYENLEQVTLVAGSVDIRHHIGRRPDPDTAVSDLALSFVDLAEELEDQWGIEVELAIPVPVEHEGRKVPKTGWYEGEPFKGTREQRLAWTEQFAGEIKAGWDRWVQPPQNWYGMDGEDYAKTHMELSSSVHIAPLSYRRHGGWQENG